MKSATKIFYSVKSKKEFIKTSNSKISGNVITTHLQTYFVASETAFTYKYKVISKSEATGASYLYKLWYKSQPPAELYDKISLGLKDAYIASYPGRHYRGVQK
jgi:hypothetical protein